MRLDNAVERVLCCRRWAFQLVCSLSCDARGGPNFPRSAPVHFGLSPVLSGTATSHLRVDWASGRNACRDSRSSAVSCPQGGGAGSEVQQMDTPRLQNESFCKQTKSDTRTARLTS
jgi:hypothetical protein